MKAGSVSDSVQRPSPLRTNSEDHGSFKTKDPSPNPDKDKAAGKKSSDSGEEADKDFILIWVRQMLISLTCFPFRKGGSNQRIFSFIFKVVPAGPVWPYSTNRVLFAGRPAVVSGNTQSQIKFNLVVYDKTININTWGGNPHHIFQSPSKPNCAKSPKSFLLSNLPSAVKWKGL